LSHILVVDDDDVILKTVEQFILSIGYACSVASDALTAMEILEERSFDLVISDIAMPQMDGIEFMRKAIALFPDLKFVIMTGYSSEYSYSGIIEAGATDFLAKPFKFEELKAKIERIERENSLLVQLREKEQKYRDLYKLSTEAEQRYLALLDSSVDAIISYDLEGNTQWINPSFTRIFGFTLDEIKGKPVPFLPDFEKEKILDIIENLVRSGTPVMGHETKRYTKDGKILDISISASRYNDHKGAPAGLVAILRNISERKRAERALAESERKYRRLSIIDGLTNLYNSRHFFDQLKKEIRRTDRHHNPLSLLLLDIDDFKSFNDRYGHLEGDKVLARMGKVIRNNLRHVDSGYRYGGEEFAVLLVETKLKAIFAVAERIRRAFGKVPLNSGNGEAAYCKVSIGGTQYIDKEDLKRFVKRADTALYQAKNQGKNQTVILDEADIESVCIPQNNMRMNAL